MARYYGTRSGDIGMGNAESRFNGIIAGARTDGRWKPGARV